MNRRVRILALLFGAVVVYAAIQAVAYPRWIKPLLTIDDRIAERQREYDKLLAVKGEVKRAKEAYSAAMTRIGSIDIGKVETDVRRRLNTLIERHQLQDAKVTPSRPTKDRKTGVEKMMVTVTVIATLESAVEFLREVSELPQLVRVGSPAIYPTSRSSRAKGPTRMNVRVPLELLVLPSKAAFVGRIKPGDEPQPETYVRHQGRDYSPIWTGKPFTEPIPLRVTTSRPVNVKLGQKAKLSAKPTGGDRDYHCHWEPADRLSDPDICDPTVDTSSAFTDEYFVTVADGSGETATASQQVTVTERKTRIARGTPENPPPPPETTVQRWKDGRYMQFVMALLRSAGTERIDEAMVYNNRDKLTSYYTVGDEFDGGELVFVHPRGGIVRNKDGYFIYPIGERLSDAFNVDEAAADDYPALKEVAGRFREAAEAAKRTEEEAATAAAESGAEAKPDASGTAQAAGKAKQGADPAELGRQREGRPKETRRATPNPRRTTRNVRKPTGAGEAGSRDSGQKGVEVPFKRRGAAKPPDGSKRRGRKSTPREKEPGKP